MTKLTELEARKYQRRLVLSRFRILNEHGFYGLLLMHMSFGIDENCKTAYTNGYRICFSPEFLDKLSDSEIDFVLMHEILHVVLKHCFRGHDLDSHAFNIACDIVVNSNILKSNNMDLSSITLKEYGTAMHEINGKEGHLFTAEEVYNLLPVNIKAGDGDGNSEGESDGDSFDDHSHWEPREGAIDEWEERLISAYQAMMQKKANGGKCDIPDSAERIFKELTDPTVNWRKLLYDFLSFDVTDYSFTPPDRRFDGPFFMPDFNEIEETTIDALFMVDTSGSVSDDDLTEAYTEISGCIEQFNGIVKGYIGFFDHNVYPAVPFETLDDLLKIKPRGGGGTDFFKIFKYVDNLDKKPNCIIILTDGYSDFPLEKVRNNIPVLWLINNNDITPPWGIVARMIKKNPN